MNSIQKRQYADRDIEKLDEQGDYYIRHISAMTSEGLHHKSEIAAELAYRDMLIDKMQMQIEEFLDGT